MGSQTVGATLATHLRLRNFDVTGIGLVALWLLSPLGTRAILGVLSPAQFPSEQGISYPYASPKY